MLRSDLVEGKFQRKLGNVEKTESWRSHRLARDGVLKEICLQEAVFMLLCRLGKHWL